ncbi:hypothetical protein ACRASX_11050 [Flavobacterium sp. TMP13]|uniref:hypothetical protein n=1 Tax=Flavobacterium sp. TMP13 TaxID=3425950 RepID=UPI003D785241
MAKAQEKATASVADAIAKTVSEYFGTVGSKDELFSTADGNVFENQGFAKNHAVTLEDKNVTPHTKANAVEVVDEEEETGDAGAAATQNIGK